MMKKALIVGINEYPTAPLAGCVNDANKIYDVLSKNEDGSPNFHCKKLIGHTKITRPLLRTQLEELFSDEVDVALFYFSGHGYLNDTGGILVTQDAIDGDLGVSMQELLTLAKNPRAHEVVIILDCCYSGACGTISAVGNDIALLREGVSVLTASRSYQPSMESDGNGVFTSLIYAALSGGAADVIGNVTIPSIYAYADQILGPWDQRPMYKSYVSKLTPLRKCNPEIELPILRLLPDYFPEPTYEFHLDSSYEPDADPKDEEHETIFKHLQKYRAARLLVPVGEEHMYYAAMHNKSCKLTPLGQFYRNMAEKGML